MKKLIILILILFGHLNAQITIEVNNNQCPIEDILTVCIGDAYPFLGKYRYTTRDFACASDPNEVLTGETEFTLNFRSNYIVDDWSFGMWKHCYDLDDGTQGTVQMYAPCGRIDTIFGTDRFGDLWSADNFNYTDSSIVFRWFNTYGEFGTTELTPIDGREILDPSTIFENDYRFKWSTGEDTQTITTNQTGDFSVTVTAPNGEVHIVSTVIQEDSSVLEPDCSPQMVKVSFFLDKNQDGVFNNEDIRLKNNLNFIDIFPDAKLLAFIGEYDRLYNVEPGFYGLSLINDQYKQTNMPDQIEVLADSGINSFDFGVYPKVSIEESEVSISTRTFERCNRIIPYQLLIRNTGTTAFNNIVELKFSDAIQFVTADQEPHEQREGFLSWDIQIPEPSYELVINILLELPDVEFIGEILCLEPSVEDNTKSFTAHCFELVCAYDPNDKYGAPFRGEHNPVYREEAIEYTVRFENLGNDTAFTVRIEDQLDNQFDPETFKFIQSSHQLSHYWINDNGYLMFEFEDIGLPPSDGESDANKGFIQYRVKPHDWTLYQTVFRNEASIFFDFNPAIITNETAHTLEMPSSIGEVVDEGLIKLSPNPVNTLLNIEIQYRNVAINNVFVYDTNGRLMGHYGNSSQINVEEYSTGIYYIKVGTNKGISNKRFVKL